MRRPNRSAVFASLALLLACPAAFADTQVTPTHVTPQASQVPETSHVVPNGMLGLHGAMITTGALGGYFMLLNAAADPGNGPVTPVKCMPIGAYQGASISADPDTMWDFPKGIVLVFSTTGCFTETQSTHAFIGVDWQ